MACIIRKAAKQLKNVSKLQSANFWLTTLNYTVINLSFGWIHCQETNRDGIIDDSK